MGHETPTPIQEKTIPHIMEGKDVLGIAQTGTGKTASFVLPILTLLEKGRARTRMPRALILQPTRELAAQVEENFIRYSGKRLPSIALLIGGVSFERQGKKLEQGVDILIATPGRLLDHFKKGKILLNRIEILVIDEADRMLDMGFIPDIERICSRIPKVRQTLFFSATMPSEIENLTKKFLNDPVFVTIAKTGATAPDISQHLVQAKKDPEEKRRILRGLIQEEQETLRNAIIFCNRKSDVCKLHTFLIRHNFNAGFLHGDMSQPKRIATLTSFREGKIQFLVASDIVARGIDVPDISHVFNYDVPTNPEDYIHRIGRTGRAGKSGKSFTIATPGDLKYLKSIEKLTKINISLKELDIQQKDEYSSPEKAPASSPEKERAWGKNKEQKPQKTVRKWKSKEWKKKKIKQP